MSDRQNIALTEVWGRDDWSNFDTYQSLTSGTILGREPNPGGGFNFGLSTQRHIDVRNFMAATWSLTTGNLSAFNHWPGLSAVLGIGTQTITSNYTKPMDLTILGSGTSLVLGLPSFPIGSVDLANSSLQLSSDGFVSHICTLSFSSSSPSLSSGNTRATWPYSSLTGIDLTKVTGVRIIIKTTAGCTVTFIGMRLIDNGWVQTNVDFDSRSGLLRQCIPLNADPTATSVPSNKIVPILWRSAQVAGIDDPRPVNGEFSFIFNTGSQSGTNSFGLYLREVTDAFITQTDLQVDTQGSLTGLPQPTLGISEFSPRTMADLDNRTMSTLDSETMQNLEDVDNPVYTSWIRFMVTWGPSPSIQITNSANPTGGHKYTTGFTFANNTTYMVICNLTDTNAQLQVYNVNQTTLAIGTLLFDTTLIPDSFFFPRRAGRVGVQASLVDGDAYVGAVRPRSLMFAEYRSAPLQSITPVQGARLYVQGSPDVELFTGWSALADGSGNVPILAPDAQKYDRASVDRVSTKVSVIKASTADPAQGVVSNLLSPFGDSISGITNFDELHIDLSIWVPSAAMSGGTINNNPIITAALIDALGNTFPVTLPSIATDQWQEISIFRPLPAPYPGSGVYQLVFYYQGLASTTWWLDNVSIHEHSIRWDGRSVVDDPWHSNYAPWTIFHETINSDTSGVHFTTQGTQLQMRAQALKQDATIISSPKLVPQYSELGRLVWPEDVVVNPNYPAATISSSNTGRTYTFDGTGSTSVNGVTNYQWSFGDNVSGTGPKITHTFPSWVVTGTQYVVSLTVIDRFGHASLTTTTVTLT